ncbi:MAG: cytochrome C oxidase subunit IV family protein [Porticoccaceae bacterium]
MTSHSDISAYVTWALLVGVTLLSWFLGADHGGLFHSTMVAGAVILTLAFVKTALVGQYFMELRFAPMLLRSGFYLWCLLTLCIVLYLYTLA